MSVSLVVKLRAATIEPMLISNVFDVEYPSSNSRFFKKYFHFCCHFLLDKAKLAN